MIPKWKHSKNTLANLWPIQKNKIHFMNLDSLIPVTPSKKIVNWMIVLLFVILLAVIIDYYWGKGNMFGLAKKKNMIDAPKTETV